MSFDTESFLSASISGSNDTKVIPCPVGEYQAVIEKVDARQWQSKDGTKTGVALDVTWLIEDQGAKAVTGREQVSVRQGIMLDTVGGQLDMSSGKNIGLGRLREAVNLNGDSFSFMQLPGQMAKVEVSHRVVGEDVFAEIKKVGKL